eukprot:TRINITY_DN6927_c0_g2_i2.p1 TRINITY_DN6927_c0_g2~~TRINITY_DN6927_c0_g2_i2.p1  ORF type:complete len:171 (-),score=26.46 TRINITY_DN6927_c0_g2_i2:14-526(-)
MSSLPFLLAYVAGIAMSTCSTFDPKPFFCESQSLIEGFHVFAYLGVGLGSAVLWNAHSGYMSQLAPKNEQGTYFGTFFSIVQVSYIVGSILPSIVFRVASVFTFFILMLILTIIAVGLFYHLPKPNPDMETPGEPFISGTKGHQTIEDTKPSNFVTEIIHILKLTRDEAI